MNHARILAITEECLMLASVQLHFGIVATRVVGFTGIVMPINTTTRDWLKKELKFKQVKMELAYHGGGKYTATVYRGKENINQLIIAQKLGSALNT